MVTIAPRVLPNGLRALTWTKDIRVDGSYLLGPDYIVYGSRLDASMDVAEITQVGAAKGDAERPLNPGVPVRELSRL